MTAEGREPVTKSVANHIKNLEEENKATRKSLEDMRMNVLFGRKRGWEF